MNGSQGDDFHPELALPRILRPVGARLNAMPTAIVGAFAVMLVALIGTVDVASGPELAFSIFYLLPIALLAWRGEDRSALVLAGVSAVTWLLADVLTHPVYSSGLIPWWNAGVRLGIFVLTANLVSHARRSMTREYELARIDPTTGLSNSRHLWEVAERELAAARRRPRPISIAYLDLDGFKQVNDQMGHAGGDALLRAVAQHLVESVRASDLVARVGCECQAKTGPP